MCRLACGHNREFPLATRPAISWILVIIHVPTCLSIFCKIIDTVLALEFIADWFFKVFLAWDIFIKLPFWTNTLQEHHLSLSLKRTYASKWQSIGKSLYKLMSLKLIVLFCFSSWSFCIIIIIKCIAFLSF